jgi:hypothetical protein
MVDYLAGMMAVLRVERMADLTVGEKVDQLVD